MVINLQQKNKNLKAVKSILRKWQKPIHDKSIENCRFLIQQAINEGNKNFRQLLFGSSEEESSPCMHSAYNC